MPKLKGESPVRISGYLNLIAAGVIEHAEWEADGITDQILYQKVISFISVHFREELSLKIVARHFGYNEKYLSHALHSLTGIHFSKLLSLYRIENAKKMLREQQLNISEIASESGFFALNSFNRTFKNTTGMTPSQYRKASRN